MRAGEWFWGSCSTVPCCCLEQVGCCGAAGIETAGWVLTSALGAESGCRLTSASLFCVSSICDSVTMLPAPPRPQVGMLDRDRKRAAFGLTSQLRRGMGEFFRVVLRFFSKKEDVVDGLMESCLAQR